MALLLREINKYKTFSQTMAQIIRCEAGRFASLYVSQKNNIAVCIKRMQVI